MNLIIKKTSDIKETDLLNCLKLWNDEMGYVYPISFKTFMQNVVNYQDKDSLVVYKEQNLVGFIILKRFDDVTLVDYTKDLFISLFYVSKKHRKEGIGALLFDFAEVIGEKRNLVIGKDIYNFFPGVPTDFDNLTDVWLEKRGFQGKRYTHDLISRDPKDFEIKNKNIVYQFCDDSKKEELISFIQKNNWKRWALEAKEYFDKKTVSDENSYLIGLYEGKIISFLRINTYKMNIVSYNVMWKERFNKLGGIGPLGVDQNFRKRGLGSDMMSMGIKTLKMQGIKEMMIDWTGLMEIYSKYNFEVWKSYKYMQKPNLKIN